MGKKTVLEAIASTNRVIPTMDRVIEEIGGGIGAHFDNYQLVLEAKENGLVAFEFIGKSIKRKCHVRKI